MYLTTSVVVSDGDYIDSLKEKVTEKVELNCTFFEVEVAQAGAIQRSGGTNRRAISRNVGFRRMATLRKCL